MAGFWSGFYSTDSYHGNAAFPYFSLSPKKFKLSETQILIEAESLYNCSKWNLVLHVTKGYRAKFADGRRRLIRTFTKRKNVRLLKETMLYNKQLTSLTWDRTGEYFPEVVAVRNEHREVRTRTTEGQYSPVQPSRLVSKRF